MRRQRVRGRLPSSPTTTPPPTPCFGFTLVSCGRDLRRWASVPEQRLGTAFGSSLALLAIHDPYGAVERLIVVARANDHGHGDGMAHDERLLACVEPGEHFAQRARPADAGENRPDVGFIVEQTRHPSSDLAHDLVIDPARALIDDEQSDVVLAQLAGDVPEDRVAGG